MADELWKPQSGAEREETRDRSGRGRRMIALVEDNREAIVDLCERFGVPRLSSFGSAATGTFDSATRAIDLLVDFDDWSPASPVDSWGSSWRSMRFPGIHGRGAAGGAGGAGKRKCSMHPVVTERLHDALEAVRTAWQCIPWLHAWCLHGKQSRGNRELFSPTLLPACGDQDGEGQPETCDVTRDKIHGDLFRHHRRPAPGLLAICLDPGTTAR